METTISGLRFRVQGLGPRVYIAETQASQAPRPYPASHHRGFWQLRLYLIWHGWYPGILGPLYTYFISYRYLHSTSKQVLGIGPYSGAHGQDLDLGVRV